MSKNVEVLGKKVKSSLSKIFVAIVLVSHTAQALANSESIKTILGKPNGIPRGLVVIAPAKKYLMQERLFSGLAAQLNNAGFYTVRFNWKESTLAVPEQELVQAAKDLNEVTKYYQQKLGITAPYTAIVTKSFSTKALLPSVQLARHHVLLTPNCSVEAPFKNTYQDILLNPEIALSIFISNEDPNCDVRQIQDTLRSMTRLPTLYLTRGDHNFVLTSGASQNYLFQDQTIQLVTSQLLIEFQLSDQR